MALDSLLVGCIGKLHYSLFPSLAQYLLPILIYCRFAYAIIAADELVAVTSTVKFRYDDGTTFLSWKVGEEVDPAVWLSLFLVIVVCVNMFPVKVHSAAP